MKSKQIFLLTTTIAAIFSAFLLAQSPDKVSQDAAIPVFPKGDEKQGRAAFEVKSCHRCHPVEGEKFPEIDLPAVDNILLCGENNAKWTRDDYAHHIMDPTHLISPDHQKAMLILGDKLAAEHSPMPMFVDALTVRDLINIATYLESMTK